MSRTHKAIKAEKIPDLKTWASLWPKAPNLSFDPVTREATIYTIDGKTKVSSFPWIREADTLTVLTNTTKFPPAVIDAAESRLSDIRTAEATDYTAKIAALREAEASLLIAWAAYSSDANRTTKDAVLAAERVIRGIEEVLVPSRLIKECMGKYYGIYLLPMPEDKRGIPIV
jgi:hypothetical protein